MTKQAIGIEQEQYCRGSDNSVILNRSCSIPMSVLTDSPYFLEEDDQVLVTVQALNEIGYSDASVLNTDAAALVMVRPHAP